MIYPSVCLSYFYSVSAIWSLIKLMLNFNFLLGSVRSIVEDSSQCFGLCSNLTSRRDSCEMRQFFSTRKQTMSDNGARTIQGQLYYMYMTSKEVVKDKNKYNSLVHAYFLKRIFFSNFNQTLENRGISNTRHCPFSYFQDFLSY